MALVFFLRLNDNGAGTTVGSVIGSTGTLVGASNTSDVYSPTGPGHLIPQSFSFNGTDQTVSITTDSIASGAAFSISVFASFAGSTGVIWGRGGNNYTFISKLSDTEIRVNTLGNQATFTVPSLGTNTFHHILVTRDTSSNVRVFVDGTESSTGPQTISNASATAFTHLAYANSVYQEVKLAWLKYYNTDESALAPILSAEKDSIPTVTLIANLASGTDISDGSPYSMGNVTVPAGGGALVVHAAGRYQSANGLVNAVTIGGTAPDGIQHLTETSNPGALVWKAVSAGSHAITVSFTVPGVPNVQRCAVAAYLILGSKTTAPFSSANGSGNNAGRTVTMNYPAGGGIGLYGLAIQNSALNHNWGTAYIVNTVLTESSLRTTQAIRAASGNSVAQAVSWSPNSGNTLGGACWEPADIPAPPEGVFPQAIIL